MSPVPRALQPDNRAAGVRIMLCADIVPTRPFGELPAEVDAVFSAIAQSDFALGDLEIPLTRRGEPLQQKLFAMRADPARADDVARIGLHAATLANNHAVDYGWAGLADTQEALKKVGIASIGAGEDLATAAQMHVHVVDGLRIGVIAFSCLAAAGMDATLGRPGISALRVLTSVEWDQHAHVEEPGDPSIVTIRTRIQHDDLARAAQCARDAKAGCDILIATLHWGYGSGEDLAEYQVPLAHALIDAGADVVHGHHPHAIHAVGFHHGMPIIFSANVLVGQQVFLDASDAVHKIWAEMSDDGFLTCIEWRHGGIVAIRLKATTLRGDRLPRFAAGHRLEAIHTRLARLSLPHGARITLEGDEILVTPV